jgi:hypothetical protein
MPRVVPSQVVATIDQMFPWAVTQTEDRSEPIGQDRSAELSALVRLVDEIPPELIVLDGPDYATYVSAVEAIHDVLATWRGSSIASPMGGWTWSLAEIRGLPQVSPVTLIRRALAKCPDEVAASGTTELPFISDTALRDSIRLDISAANQGLAQGEWKGATVLGASAVEALLLWALREHDKNKPGDVARAVADLVKAKKLKSDPGSDLEGPGWHLHEYVEVAARLGIIKPDTADQVRLAKDARNLVHPGRAARLGQKCDRGTTLTALAAVETVARDLTP